MRTAAARCAAAANAVVFVAGMNEAPVKSERRDYRGAASRKKCWVRRLREGRDQRVTVAGERTGNGVQGTLYTKAKGRERSRRSSASHMPVQYIVTEKRMKARHGVSWRQPTPRNRSQWTTQTVGCNAVIADRGRTAVQIQPGPSERSSKNDSLGAAIRYRGWVCDDATKQQARLNTRLLNCAERCHAGEGFNANREDVYEREDPFEGQRR